MRAIGLVITLCDTRYANRYACVVSNAFPQLSYPGVALLMFVESNFLPTPSELIMPLAGIVAARGELNLTLVILARTLGSMLGVLPWYYAGAYLGGEHIKRLMDPKTMADVVA